MIELSNGARPSSPIAFAGRIAGTGANGAHDVRLDNGHHVEAYDAKGPASASRPTLGARVSVEMAHNEMRGWRLTRR